MSDINEEKVTEAATALNAWIVDSSAHKISLTEMEQAVILVCEIMDWKMS